MKIMANNTIYIVPIEPIDQRYTRQWYDNIPKILESEIQKRNLSYDVVTVYGAGIEDKTSSGAFLDFGATNVYKASQAMEISKWFSQGKIRPGDKFLVTDAWNFVITPIKYMSDLLDIPVEIHSIWHAGAYDPTDILGYRMKKPWPWEAERSWFYASDYNYYATNFHKDMFLRNLNIDPAFHSRAIRSGQPHELIVDQLTIHQNTPKQRRVMWPHRYNADKQPEIAEDLAGVFDMVITQKQSLAKSEYYQVMGSSRAIFSCALHENLGISVMEAVLTGAIPIVPDRASYREMYLPEFKYPAEWTASLDAYRTNKQNIVNFINERIDNPEEYQESIRRQQQILIDNYLNSTVMINNILK